MAAPFRRMDLMPGPWAGSHSKNLKGRDMAVRDGGGLELGEPRRARGAAVVAAGAGLEQQQQQEQQQQRGCALEHGAAEHTPASRGGSR